MSKESVPVNPHVEHLEKWAKETSKANSDIGLVRHQEKTGVTDIDTSRLHAASERHKKVAKAALEQACPNCIFADVCSTEGNTEKIKRSFPTAKERNELVKRAKKGEACSASWLRRPYDGFTESPEDEAQEEAA